MPLDGSQLDETKILIEGRRRIEESWFHGDPQHGKVPWHEHCAVLAISRQNIGDLTVPVLMAVARAAGFGDIHELQPWNDLPETTKERVLEVYDIAIAASLSGSA